MLPEGLTLHALRRTVGSLLVALGNDRPKSWRGRDTPGRGREGRRRADEGAPALSSRSEKSLDLWPMPVRHRRPRMCSAANGVAHDDPSTHSHPLLGGRHGICRGGLPDRSCRRETVGRADVGLASGAPRDWHSYELSPGVPRGQPPACPREPPTGPITARASPPAQPRSPFRGCSRTGRQQKPCKSI